MKTGSIVLIVLVALLLILGIGGCGSYNGMNTSRENVNTTWANLQSQYQRRADLIPNLVATVKGAADFEKSTYVQVAQARAGQLKNASNVSADQLTPEKTAEIQRASSEAASAMRTAINIAVEAYPQLRSNENFLSLQNQLEGTENRIVTERNRYNESVRDYNLRISNFPAKLYSGMFGFQRRTMFESSSDPKGENAPRVSF